MANVDRAGTSYPGMYPSVYPGMTNVVRAGTSGHPRVGYPTKHTLPTAALADWRITAVHSSLCNRYIVSVHRGSWGIC